MDRKKAIQVWFTAAMEKQAGKFNASNARAFTKQKFLDGLQADNESRIRPNPKMQLLRMLSNVTCPKAAEGFATTLCAPLNERMNAPEFHAALEAIMGFAGDE